MKTILAVTIDGELFKRIERLKGGNRSAFVEELLRVGLTVYLESLPGKDFEK